MFWPSLKILLIFANLKPPVSLFKDTDIYQISVTGLARTMEISFKNLPGNFLMPPASAVLISLEIFSI